MSTTFQNDYFKVPYVVIFRVEIGCNGKIISQTSNVIKTVYQIYIKTTARVGYVLSFLGRAQVQELKESRLTIRRCKDQGPVPYEEV